MKVAHSLSLSLILTFLTVASGFVLASSTIYATSTDSSVDNISLKVPVNCTLAGTVNTAHSATVNPGTVESDIGITTLKAACNDADGFAIYTAGYTDDILGKNVLTSAELGPSYDIATGTGTSENSQWAMKLATNSGATYPIAIQNNFNNYHVVPSSYLLAAKRTAATDTGDAAIGSVLTTTYQVYASSSQHTGNYTGQVIYTLVHPNNKGGAEPLADCPINAICYAPNSVDIEGSMSSLGAVSSSPTAGAQQITDIFATTLTLIAPNYSRPGYGFAGWSKDFDVTTHTEPVVFGPNETITFSSYPDDRYVNPGDTLYPVWIKSTGSIQEWDGCSNLFYHYKYHDVNHNKDVYDIFDTMTALTDLRDGNVYTVAKLADGTCWMTENLRLDAENSTGDNRLLAQGYKNSQNYGNFIGMADSEDANFTDNTVANSLYSTDGSRTINMGTNNSKYRMPRYNNNNTNIGGSNSSGTDLIPSHNASTNNAQWYAYGNYYTYSVAKANLTPFTNKETSETAGTSICPKGWRLPYGDNRWSSGRTPGNFSWLDIETGGSGTKADSLTNPTGAERSMVWRAYPNNFVLPGRYNGSAPVGRGGGGLWWSSSAGTASTPSHAFALSIGMGTIQPGDSSQARYGGYSIRCVIDVND